MTSIKPPLPPVVPLDPAQGSSGVDSAESTAGAERAAAPASVGAERAGAGAPAPGPGGVGGAAPAGQAGPAPQADPIAELAAAITRGELSAAQAMDRLVDRALAGVSAHLDGAQRAELAAVLRAALDGDPAVRDALGAEGAG